MPISKFSCRICGEKAPAKLLEHGNFDERFDWLRTHYKENHPKKWKDWQRKILGKKGIK